MLIKQIPFDVLILKSDDDERFDLIWSVYTLNNYANFIFETNFIYLFTLNGVNKVSDVTQN